ncbi:MAG: serine hydrolase [Phycisphaeraceae bacterium]|nr:MAG: serine hydrolase [Phycisphaeraceae bacterium]
MSRFARGVVLAVASLGLVPAVCPGVALPAGAMARAAERAPVEGTWEGAIELPGIKLGISVRLTEKDGVLSGTISIPDQGAKDLPLDKASRDGDVVTFAIKGVPGDPTFRGTLMPGGATLSGEFTQGGAVFPFTLRRDSATNDAAALEGFEGWVDGAMKAWGVPGMAVVIVKGERVVLSRGFGSRDVEGGKPVTDQTLFAIGSSSKAFTCAVLSSLVDEGLLRWDEPVRTWMPDFSLSDDEVARRLTPVDLVTHRSGMPRHDLMWYNSPYPRSELVRRMRYLPLNKGVRESFQYNNLMYAASGELIARVTGRTWEDETRARVFEPLGMTRANFGVVDSQRDPDHALPYREDEGSTVRMNFRDISNVGPAGSINASAADMARWAMLQVSSGEVGGRRVLSADALRSMHTPRMHVEAYPDMGKSGSVMLGYGLGWFIESYRGHVLVHHGGNIDGFSAMVAFLPREGWGIVVLSNLNGTPLPGLVVRHAADRVLGLERRDWSGEGLAEREAAKALQKDSEAKKESVRKSGTSPAHPMEAYAGDYEHPGYGTARIELKDGRLHITLNNITMGMEHWHYEVFNTLKNPGEAVLGDHKVQFITGMDGEVEALRTQTDPLVELTVFTRRPDAELSDPAFLERLAGDYQLGPQRVTVLVKGEGLAVSVPGQPSYDLVAKRHRTFELKGLSGFSVVFTVEGSGKASGLRFLQPNGVFDAARVE